MNRCKHCGANITSTAGCPNGCVQAVPEGEYLVPQESTTLEVGTPAIDLGPLVDELKAMNVNLRDIWAALSSISRG